MARNWDLGDLGTHVYREVAHTRHGRGWSPNTEPTSFTDAVGWFMKQAAGNISAAARLAGVPRESFRDWTRGKSTPNAQRRAQVARSAQLSERRDRLRPGRESRLRDIDTSNVTVKAVYNYDGGAPRTLKLGDYMDDGAIERLVDVYLNGGDASELRESFAAEVMDPNGFYTRTLAQPPTDDHGWTVSSLNF